MAKRHAAPFLPPAPAAPINALWPSADTANRTGLSDHLELGTVSEIANDDSICFAWMTAPVTSWRDVGERQFTVGGLAPRGELVIIGVTADPLPISPVAVQPESSSTPGVSAGMARAATGRR